MYLALHRGERNQMLKFVTKEGKKVMELKDNGSVKALTENLKAVDNVTEKENKNENN